MSTLWSVVNEGKGFDCWKISASKARVAAARVSLVLPQFAESLPLAPEPGLSSVTAENIIPLPSHKPARSVPSQLAWER